MTYQLLNEGGLRRPSVPRPSERARRKQACRGGLLVLAMLAASAIPGRIPGAESELLATTTGDVNHVLASVDGMPISLGEVLLELRAALRERRPEAADEPHLVRAMLEQIVRRRLALAALIADRRATSDGYLDRALAARKTQFEVRSESLDEFLQTNGISLESYRRRLHWELSWAAYKDEILTEENLQQFFDRHRRHFDGTEVRASHILIRNAESGVRSEEGEIPNSEAEGSIPHDAALVQAREIRAAIEAGELTFAEAAGEYSAGPSRERGGDIGYFPRRGVMHEDFAAAAFRLKPGEVSPPVVTPFGMHLIQVTGEKPGSKQFIEVRENVYRAAEARLFDALVAAGSKHADVERADAQEPE